MTSFDLPDSSGIYRIVCTPTKKFYIGSTNNLRRRWQDHRKALRGNRHTNQKLQNAWNKYGEDAFAFEVLELVLPVFQVEREQFWLDKLKPAFNIARDAQASRLGVELSPEARAKQSLMLRGNTRRRNTQTSPTARENIRASQIGKHNKGKPRVGYTVSPETRAKLSIAHTGKHGKGIPRIEHDGYQHSPETREKMKASHLGKKLSEQAKIKLAEANRGKQMSPEAREKLRLAKLGRPLSAEHRANNRASKTAQMKTLVIIAPDGTEHLVTGIKAFCQEHGLDCSNLMRVAKGEYSHHKGWRARFPE